MWLIYWLLLQPPSIKNESEMKLFPRVTWKFSFFFSVILLPHEVLLPWWGALSPRRALEESYCSSTLRGANCSGSGICFRSLLDASLGRSSRHAPPEGGPGGNPGNTGGTTSLFWPGNALESHWMGWRKWLCWVSAETVVLATRLRISSGKRWMDGSSSSVLVLHNWLRSQSGSRFYEKLWEI